MASMKNRILNNNEKVKKKNCKCRIEEIQDGKQEINQDLSRSKQTKFSAIVLQINRFKGRLISH